MQMSLLLTAAALPALAQSHWAVTKTFPIGGAGRWDYVTVDAPNHRLFVTRTTHTMAIDSQTGKTLGDIPGQKGSHGVAIAPKSGRGFITDGEGAAIVVFDLKTYAVLGKIPAVDDVDGIIYDAKTDRVLAAAGDSKALVIINPSVDPKNGKPEATVTLPGKPEFVAADGNGKAFVNINDKNTVAAVDITAHKVLAEWPITPGGQPTGLSIDAANHRLFIGCRKPQDLVVMNTETGKIESSVPVGVGVDATAFGDGEAFASTGDGVLTVAAEQGGKLQVVQSVKTEAGARTMGLDTQAHQIFLPTADMLPAAPGARAQPKPDSFHIVVVSRQ